MPEVYKSRFYKFFFDIIKLKFHNIYTGSKMNRKLYRSRRNRTIGGVAAGLGEYFDIDATLVKIIFVISLFLGGTGIIAYILLWIVIPEEPYPGFAFNSDAGTSPGETSQGEKTVNQDTAAQYEEYARRNEERKKKRLLFLGIGLILAGFFFLADNFIPHIHFTDFLSIVLIAIGIGLLINLKKLNTN
jgi:phage shock protein PspC (stress-responsive transcriptional regulator)